jgi:hypothetical protein
MHIGRRAKQKGNEPPASASPTRETMLLGDVRQRLGWLGADEGIRRVMGPLRREIRALETTEHVIARLTVDPDHEETISRLIAAIEQDRAELLAAIVGGHATHREPQRIRNPVE